MDGIMAANGKIIVFDWNGTLFDDAAAIHACTNVVLKRSGHAPVDFDTFQARHSVSFRQSYENMGFDEVQIENLLSSTNDIFHDHYESLADKGALRAGAADILDRARTHKVKTLILSNHIEEPIRFQLKRLAIDHLIDEVLAHASRALQFRDITKGERLQRFMAAHKAAPQSMIIIGDTSEEIHIAKKLNLASIAITGGCTAEALLRAERPNHLIHSLHELKPILQERGFVA